jgi:hypothetical protein
VVVDGGHLCPTGFQLHAPAAPSSRESSAIILSSSRTKSKTLRFSMIREGVSDLGSGTIQSIFIS